MVQGFLGTVNPSFFGPSCFLRQSCTVSEDQRAGKLRDSIVRVGERAVIVYAPITNLPEGPVEVEQSDAHGFLRGTPFDCETKERETPLSKCIAVRTCDSNPTRGGDSDCRGEVQLSEGSGTATGDHVTVHHQVFQGIFRAFYRTEKAHSVRVGKAGRFGSKPAVPATCGKRIRGEEQLVLDDVGRQAAPKGAMIVTSLSDIHVLRIITSGNQKGSVLFVKKNSMYSSS